MMGFEKDTTAVKMTAERGQRFHKALCEAIQTNDSLAILAKDFKQPEIFVGEADPALVIDAMTTAVAARLSLLLNMLNNEEHLTHPLPKEVE